VLADTGVSVTATDVNQATLEVAKARRARPPSVAFAVADAFQLHTIRDDYDAAFADFFWSHVLLAKIDTFLESLMLRLLPVPCCWCSSTIAWYPGALMPWRGETTGLRYGGRSCSWSCGSIAISCPMNSSRPS